MARFSIHLKNSNAKEFKKKKQKFEQMDMASSWAARYLISYSEGEG
jgi:hypothetical protein